MKYERMKTFTLIFAFYIVHFSKAFINPGVGIGLPSGFKIPSLGMTENINIKTTSRKA